MLISKENLDIRNRTIEFEKRIEEMHLEFYKYCYGEESRRPDSESFEQELVNYSRKNIIDMELSKNFDRVLYKFQNRKKVWRTWTDDMNQALKKKLADAKAVEVEDRP
ncbi:MAG: hypothetical protein JRJ02_09965 [Deltaproteobacteria bacterium]|nr:hypothetical protein [Deltaproteobacteria bacterium]